MGIRNKYRKAIIGNFILFFVFLCISFYVSSIFMAVYVVIMIILAIYGGFQKCMNCGKYVQLNPLFEGSDKLIWTFWIPKYCTKCGAPID